MPLLPQALRRPHAGPAPRLARLILPAVLALTSIGLPAAPDEPTTHVLYLGADFSVDWRGKACRVVDVESESLVVEVDGVRTPLRDAATQLAIRMAPAMKLGRDSAEVSDLKGTSMFSEANNPYRASEQGAALAGDATVVADLAAANLRGAEGMANSSSLANVADPTLKAMLGGAQEAYQYSLHAQGSTSNSPTGQAQAAGAGEDAFLLSFTVAAPRALRRPYAMVVVRYREQPDNARTARFRIYSMTLARVDPKPRRYHLRREGLPPGYQLDRYEVHLYDEGKEIATSVAPKRVDLTTEDAFQYALISHAADLKGKTQAPVPARDFWPADLSARLDEGNRNRLVFVRVNRDGRSIGAYHDAEGKLPIVDRDITALLPDLRFLPALEKGKAAAGICRVNLGDEAL